MNAKEFIRLVTFVLLLLLGSFVLNFPFSAKVKAEPNADSIDVNSEYSNGTIASSRYLYTLWYVWINCNGTQVLYLAYKQSNFRSAVCTFFGQRFISENNEEVFVGNSLVGMEVYNDTHGSGVPEGCSDILYDILVNSSASCEVTPVEKSMVQGVAHYTWGTRYDGIDGLIAPDSEVKLFGAVDLSRPWANVTVEYMNFSYDFSVIENMSILKTSFGIGRIAVNGSNFNLTLDGLSLYLVYGTTILTPASHETLINGLSYNSMTAQASTASTKSGEVTVENVTAYDFLFGQNYTVLTGSGNQSIQSLAIGTAQESLLGDTDQKVEWLLSESDVGGVLNDVFSKVSTTNEPINLNYVNSSFLYGVCYPVWSGNPIQHDPEYVAHLITSNGGLSATTFPWVFLVFAAIIGSGFLLGAIYDLRRTRKTGFLRTLCRFEKRTALFLRRHFHLLSYTSHVG